MERNEMRHTTYHFIPIKLQRTEDFSPTTAPHLQSWSVVTIHQLSTQAVWYPQNVKVAPTFYKNPRMERNEMRHAAFLFIPIELQRTEDFSPTTAPHMQSWSVVTIHQLSTQNPLILPSLAIQTSLVEKFKHIGTVTGITNLRLITILRACITWKWVEW